MSFLAWSDTSSNSLPVVLNSPPRILSIIAAALQSLWLLLWKGAFPLSMVYWNETRFCWFSHCPSLEEKQKPRCVVPHSEQHVQSNSHQDDSEAPEIARLVVLLHGADGAFEHLGGGVVQREAGRRQPLLLWLQPRKPEIYYLDVGAVRRVFEQQILQNKTQNRLQKHLSIPKTNQCWNVHKEVHKWHVKCWVSQVSNETCASQGLFCSLSLCRKKSQRLFFFHCPHKKTRLFHIFKVPCLYFLLRSFTTFFLTGVLHWPQFLKTYLWLEVPVYNTLGVHEAHRRHQSLHDLRCFSFCEMLLLSDSLEQLSAS